MKKNFSSMQPCNYDDASNELFLFYLNQKEYVIIVEYIIILFSFP